MHTFMKSSASHKSLLLVFLGVLLVLSFASLVIGASSYGVKEAFHWITGSADQTAAAIFRFIRLPRTLACLLAGASLAVAGLLLQTALNNPLASPGIIGVNAGSGFFVVGAAILFPAVFWVRGLAAFSGAFLVALSVYALAMKTGATKTTIILAGIAISSLVAAGTDTLIMLFPEAVMDRNAFFIGGFASIHQSVLLFSLPFILLGLLGSRLLVGRLDLLLLGDEVAASLGLNVRLCRFLTILCASALAASAVSIAGLIGFVGLIVPHIMRQLVGNELRIALPTNILFGAILVLLSDITARLVFSPYEIPAGILLSAIGTPFFLHLILSRRRHRFDLS